MHHFFAYIDRMRYIERWALMRNSVRENIQEHSHQVAVLAHALAVIRNELFGGQVDTGAVAAAALYHDAGEILTGDMPTPIKYFNPEIREAYRKVEEVADEKLLDMLPPELRPVYEDILRPADPEVEELVKAADKLSAHIKCLEELKAGNEEFRQAARQCPHLRADTHAANLTMRHCMERAGFVYCGVIYVADGTPRVAYEKV